MIRGFSIGLGIISIRLVAGLLIIPAQGQFRPGMLALAFWIGFGGTLLVAEWWVRATRRPARAVRSRSALRADPSARPS